MNKDRTIKYKRFKEAFDYLKLIERISNQKDLADILHKTPETISRVVSGKGNNPTDKFLIDFARAFSDVFNEDYILHGNGVLLKEQSIKQLDSVEETEEQNEKVIWYRGELVKRDKIISFLQKQIDIKDKEIDRLHTIIEKFSPMTEKEGEAKKVIGV